jgi:hypothetical protein
MGSDLQAKPNTKIRHKQKVYLNKVLVLLKVTLPVLVYHRGSTPSETTAFFQGKVQLYQRYLPTAADADDHKVVSHQEDIVLLVLSLLLVKEYL